MCDAVQSLWIKRFFCHWLSVCAVNCVWNSLRKAVWRECLRINLAFPWCSAQIALESACDTPVLLLSLLHAEVFVLVRRSGDELWMTHAFLPYSRHKSGFQWGVWHVMIIPEHSISWAIVFEEPLTFVLLERKRHWFPLALLIQTTKQHHNSSQKKLLAPAHNPLPTSWCDVNNAIFSRKYDNREYDNDNLPGKSFMLVAIKLKMHSNWLSSWIAIYYKLFNENKINKNK